MKALIFKEPYRFACEEIPRPAPGPGEVLVKVRSVGACGSDVHGFAGKTGRRYPGMVMGHEISGEVAGLGGGLDGLAPGQHVVVQPIIHCGACEMCRRGMTSVCLNKRMVGVNMDTTGGLTEYLSVPAGNVFPIAPAVRFPLAALAEPFAVGAGAVSRSCLQAGDSVAIVGGGMIGLAILAAVLQRKPSVVYVVEQSRKKLLLAEKLGGKPVDVNRGDPVKCVLDQTRRWGVDVAFEAVGIAATVRTAQAMTRTGGEIVWVGNSQRLVEVDMQDIVTGAKRIQGIYCYTDGDFLQAVHFIEDRVDLARLFAEEEVDLSGAQALFGALARGEKELLRGIVNVN